MSSQQRGERFKLIFTSPPTDLPAIKSAIFNTGAGCYPTDGTSAPTYTEVCCEWPVKGQFKPSALANPAIGHAGSAEVEIVEEVRCEVLVVGRDLAARAVEALKAKHPYEEPAYEVIKIEDF